MTCAVKMAIIAGHWYVCLGYFAVLGVFPEVNDINRQKFLAELGKLLTFMYEEDRQTALAMYEKMFDDTDDEMGLIQFLGSPTRQAVVIARCYNARVRKLQVESQSRERAEDGSWSEETPEFVLVIDKLYQQVVPDRVEGDFTLENQVSLFEAEPAPVVESEAPAAPPVPEDTVEAAEAQSDGLADEVNRFLDSFSIAEEPVPSPTEDDAYAPAVEDEVDYEGEPASRAEPVTERKPRVLLLILFVLLAVPVTLAAALVLLVPTLLFLSLAAASGASGVVLLTAAFGGFKILADFLLLFGTAIILLALGLLFLWIFIWFIGGAIAGLIAGVIRLGGRWCYKEVAA